MKIKNYMEFNEDIKNSDYYIPSYEECRRICDVNDNFIFYETKHRVDGYDISIFNYRLSQPGDFHEPILGNNKIKAYELRGLTFVFNTDGTLFKRFLLLNKFWNIDQSDCSMYSVIKDFKIKNIYNKEDGSIASFIKLPNGKTIARSKASFSSDQAVEIQKIYEKSKNIKRFVDWALSNDIVPIFEYVSPQNKIVVQYSNTDLILLRMRDNLTGEYLDINDYVDKLDGISVVNSDSGKTLEDLIELKSIIKGKEGWVIQFENGKMVKLKTDWYNSLHRLYTEDAKKENILISLILDEKIDDIISQLDPDDTERREFIEKLTKIVNNYIIKISKEIDDLVLKYEGDEKDFAMLWKKHKLFPFAMGVIKGKDKFELIINWVKKQTFRLQQAANWVKENEYLLN